MNKIKNLKENSNNIGGMIMYKGIKKFVKKINKAAKNEDGFGILEWVFTGAIILLGLFGLKTPVATFFSGIWSSAATFFTNLITDLFA